MASAVANLTAIPRLSTFEVFALTAADLDTLSRRTKIAVNEVLSTQLPTQEDPFRLIAEYVRCAFILEAIKRVSELTERVLELIEREWKTYRDIVYDPSNRTPVKLEICGALGFFKV